MELRLDRTAFRIQTHEDEERTKVFKHASYQERLAIATYLIRTAYGISDTDEMRMDRTQFSIRKRDANG